jgi:branched-chain amino acid transport system ATP-binding protein
MTAILELENVHTFIGQYHILEGVTLDVPENSIVAMLGRNGAGKTTTLRSIIGLNPPTQGTIRFKGQVISGRRPYHIAQMGIGYVPDYRAIFKQLTVEENLRVAERKSGDLAQKKALIFSIFPDLERLYRWPGGQLSGGQQQMLAIARALVSDNHLLLIDEPSEGLAPVIIEQMMTAIRQLGTSNAVLLVEQNFHVASQLAEYYVIIEDGKSVKAGMMSDLTSDKMLVTQYLGAA